jgi:hypothetical protein
MLRNLLIFLCVVFGTLSVYGQTEKPITKEDFFSSIKLGRKEGKTAERYIELVKQYKVNFLLTRKDKQALRLYGTYLGKSGLDSLILAVRDNYQPKRRPSAQPSISQTMTSSPGAIQAGGSVIINPALPPRTLSQKQNSDFIKALKQSPPIEIIQLGCFVGSEEACVFANQLLAAFREAGWPIEGNTVDFMTATTRGQRGMILFKRGKPVANSPLWEVITTPTLAALKTAFGIVGIDAQITAHTSLAENKIQIYVGAQP